MASICKIDGKWRALIRRKGRKPISKFFDTKPAATAWASKIEAQIDEGKPVVVDDGLTVATLIQRYRGLRDKARPRSSDSCSTLRRGPYFSSRYAWVRKLISAL